MEYQLGEHLEIREHLHLEGKDENEYTGATVCADYIRRQLASLAGLMLLDEAEVGRIQLIADGKEYSFSGKEITAEYKAIIDALWDAEDIDLMAAYEYVWKPESVYDNAGPFDLMTMLDCFDDLDMDDVLYTAWSHGGFEHGCGVLAAYGTKDGKTFKGPVQFEKAAHVSAGEWFCQDAPVFASAAKTGKDQLSAFYAAGEEFTAFCSEDDMLFTEYEDTAEFWMANLDLSSDDDVRRLIEMLKELRQLADNDFSLMINMTDFSQKDVRLMTIEEDGEGDFCINIASV